VSVPDRRIASLLIVFVVLLGVGLLRAAYLESVKSGGLQRAAAVQQVTRVNVPAVRGTITDRDGVQLALSESADEVVADPYLIKDPVRVAKQLFPLLGKPLLTVVGLVSERHTAYVRLAHRLAADRATEIQKLNIDGINLSPDTIRDYPRGSQAAQVLGYVGFDGQGLDGLEYGYNNVLQGSNGIRKVVNDAIGQPISVDEVRSARPGKPLALTIDSALQSEMEQVLAGIGAQYSPVGATAIAVDPTTGAIRGLANWPSVNSNDPSASPATAWEDHAVGFSYEPGSTFKAITVAGALQDGLITPNTEFSIPPLLQVADREIHDAENHGYETLSVEQILQVSSNIGADKIGLMLGRKRFDHWVHQFGFGAPTGIDLPGEQRGIVLHWWQYSGSSMGNLPFGQGESVTPMQMVAAYDAIANGGILRPPHIVQAIGGKPLPVPPGRRIMSGAVALELREMLRGVFADGGTASGAAISGYDLAGKTGTANIAVDGHYSGSAFVASFIGMVPTVDPKLVVAVVVDQPQGSIFGGSVAAPAFQKIVGWAVPYFGISPCPSPCAPSVLNGTTP